MKPLALGKKTCRQLRGAVTRRASITLTWPEDAPEGWEKLGSGRLARKVAKEAAK